MGERSTYSIFVEVFFLKYIMNSSLVLREGHTLRKDEKLHRFIYSLSHLVSPLLLGKYSYRTAQAPELDFPYMVMSNHTTEADMIMLMRAFKKHMYFVCGEHLLRSKFGPVIRKLFDPIPAPRGGSMQTTVKEILRRIANGNNIMMFPEGARSFTGVTDEATPAAGKLLKKAHCGLVTYRMHGGYFIAPRWAYHFRRGHAEGEIVNIYTPEQISKMSSSEITDAINRDLAENAYDRQEKKAYIYSAKGLAEGLENILIICPRCGSYDSVIAKGDRFKCKCCGLGGKMDEYGFLKGDGLPFSRVDSYSDWLSARFDSDMEKTDPDKPVFTEKNIRLYEIFPAEHKTKDISTGTLKLYKDRMVFGEREFMFHDIVSMSLLYFGKSFLFTCPDGYFGLTGENYHAWKTDRLCRIYKIKQQSCHKIA